MDVFVANMALRNTVVTSVRSLNPDRSASRAMECWSHNLAATNNHDRAPVTGDTAGCMRQQRVTYRGLWFVQL